MHPTSMNSELFMHFASAKVRPNVMLISVQIGDDKYEFHVPTK